MSHNTTNRPRMAATYAPLTGRALPRVVWWIIEIKEQGAAPRPSRSVLGAGNAQNPGAAVAAPGVQANSVISAN